MIHKLDDRLNDYASPVLGIFRIVIGLLFTMNGTVKLLNWPVAPASGSIPVGTWPYWWAGLIELIVGLLVMFGLFTRLAALVGSGEMAYAYFTAHQPDGLWPIENNGELAVLYCFSFFLIAFVGAGAFALQSNVRR
jgi:putative oxidoreductase